MFKLQRAIYKNDSRLRLAELNKMDAIIDNALNVILNIIGLNKIIIDKHKDIDGYESKLANVITKKFDLLEKVDKSIIDIIDEIKNETNMIYKKMCKVSKLDMDTLYLINGTLNEIMTHSKKDLIKIKADLL